jgi:hypothetical protein
MLNIDYDCEKHVLEHRLIEEQYKEACRWISDLGIEYKRTRFGDYERDLEEFVKSGNSDNKEERLKVFFNAQLEAIELIRVKNTLDSFNSAYAIETIKKSVAGQKFRNGSNADQSRDFAFELSMAGRFIKAGYHVDLRTITDIVVEIDGRRLYVECKRIKSVKQLQKRVKEAYKQTKVRLENDMSSRSRSLVALNLTDIINPRAMPVITTTFDRYKSMSARTLGDFVKSKERILLKNQHTKSLGTFAEFTTQGLVTGPGEFALLNSREAQFINLRLKAADLEFLCSFAEKLGNQNAV